MFFTKYERDCYALQMHVLMDLLVDVALAVNNLYYTVYIRICSDVSPSRAELLFEII